MNISLSEQHSFPLADVFRFLQPASVEQLLEQAVLDSPIFATRWRWVAGRALALLRFMGGKKVPPQIQRMRSDDLLAAVFPQALACQENISGEIVIPGHPLVREAMKDSLREAMDVEGLKSVLAAIASGEIQCLAVDTPVPSPFSHEILNANPYAYLDDAPLEERRARAVEMRRVLPESVLSEIGRLDPNAIAEVRQEAWPDIRSADELHDFLQDVVVFPETHLAIFPFIEGSPKAGWADHFDALAAESRVTRARHGERSYWVAAEKAEHFATLFPEARFETELPEIKTPETSREALLALCVGAWMSHLWPLTSSALVQFLDFGSGDIEQALLRLEASGSILRGQFTESSRSEIEWCDRRLLARIHRLTVGALRKQIQPVTSAQFMSWLLRWQHVAPGTQLLGDRGTLEALQQLQGFEAPANAWEDRILARRVANYDPRALDQLCLTGAVGWGRLSAHPAMAEDADHIRRRVTPSSVAPITFFIREDADWMIPRHGAKNDREGDGLSPGARDVLVFLRQRGASFFADILRGTKMIKASVEAALWELVTVGVITADGFDNIRAMIDPRRRAGKGKGHSARPRHSVGRWSILHAEDAAEREQALEAMCWTLLRRYGVVFREILTRESIVPRWRDLLITFRRLEDRGEIRGGRFVSGFLGEQFALPISLESLRASSRLSHTGEVITLSAADPLNLVGIVVPGERIPPTSLKTYRFAMASRSAQKGTFHSSFPTQRRVRFRFSD